MNFLGNLIWLVFGGIISAILWLVSGMVLCVTVIGIPFGIQCFKIGALVLWPFGKDVEIGNFGAGGLLMNLLWLVLFGWEFAVLHVVFGLLFCVTIIGIPFGLQHFKLARLGLIPFGATIR
jgi:uncharacterized membrane protein YccF (DUF307 family)